MDTKWSPTTKYIVAVGMVLAGLAVLWISRPMLGIITIAIILAFLTAPVVRFLHKRLRFPRGLAAVTAFLLLILIIALIPIIITPIAIDAASAINIDAFITWVQAQVGGLENWLASIRTFRIFDIRFTLAPIVDPALEALAGTSPGELASLEQLLQLIPSAFNSVTSLAGFLASTIGSVALNVFLTLIIAIYLAIDAPRFYHGMIELAPGAYREEFRKLLSQIADVWSAYFRGQITVSVILALITWLAATIIGLPGAFILGLSAGVLALIPSLGPILALIPAVIVALVQGTTAAWLQRWEPSNLTFALIVLGVYLFIQQLEGNLITPRIVGQAIDLPPVVVLLGVVVGTSTAGLLGTVLAAPVIATAKVLSTYAWNKLVDRDPFANLEPKPVRSSPKPPPAIGQAVRSTYENLQGRYQAMSATDQLFGQHFDEEE